MRPIAISSSCAATAVIEFSRMISRRSLLGALGVAVVAPRLAFAQAARRVSIVVLFAGESDDDEPATRAFFDEMRRRGWVEGTNIAYERLYGRGSREYMEGLAETAAGRAPDLIYATTTNIALAVLKAGEAVPVVFMAASDPVASGLVSSLARPNRNATGTYQNPSNVVGKRFELIREAFPRLKRIGVLHDRRSAEYQRQKAGHQEAARRAGLALAEAEFTNYEAVAKILARFRRDGIAAVTLTPSFTLFARRREVSETAARNGIALVAHRVEWAEAGALMTYGAEIAESLRRSAGIADRILKGARPADIPVEQVTKLELVISRRTANELGLSLPASLLQRAHQLID